MAALLDIAIELAREAQNEPSAVVGWLRGAFYSEFGLRSLKLCGLAS